MDNNVVQQKALLTSSSTAAPTFALQMYFPSSLLVCCRVIIWDGRQCDETRHWSMVELVFYLDLCGADPAIRSRVCSYYLADRPQSTVKLVVYYHNNSPGCEVAAVTHPFLTSLQSGQVILNKTCPKLICQYL